MASHDQSRDVCDVGHHQRPRLVADLADPREVDHPRVCRCAADDQPRLVLQGELLHLLVVDALIVLAHVVADDLEVAAGVRQGMAVSEVAAMSEVHAHDGVAGLEHREVDGHVCLRAGVRLHIGVLGAEELLRPVDGDGLDDVGRSAPAVVPLAGVSLGVLVGEDGAHGREHGDRDVVLRGDQLEGVVLTRRLAPDGGSDLRVHLGKRSVEEAVSHRRGMLLFVNRRHDPSPEAAILQ